MDLVYDFLTALRYPKATIQHLYAYEVYTKPTDLTRQYFDLLPNTATFIPQDGDIAVYDKTASNVAGHIGVALGGGTVASFRCFEQNYPVGTNAFVRFRDYNTPRLLGVLRPKVFDSLIINDQTVIPAALLNWPQDLEIQQIRGILSDNKNTISNLENKISQAKAILS